jgi:hypothetical protein
MLSCLIKVNIAAGNATTFQKITDSMTYIKNNNYRYGTKNKQVHQYLAHLSTLFRLSPQRIRLTAHRHGHHDIECYAQNRYGT